MMMEMAQYRSSEMTIRQIDRDWKECHDIAAVCLGLSAVAETDCRGHFPRRPPAEQDDHALWPLQGPSVTLCEGLSIFTSAVSPFNKREHINA